MPLYFLCPVTTHYKGLCCSSSEEPETKAAFEAWAAEHGKSYNTPEEKEKRFGIFREKLRSIEIHNSSHGEACKKRLTKFSDRTWDELHWTYCYAGFDRQRASRRTAADEDHEY